MGHRYPPDLRWGLKFFYYHELGFFLRYKIPIEFIQVEILNSVQYLPVFLLGVIIGSLTLITYSQMFVDGQTSLININNKFKVSKIGIWVVAFTFLLISIIMGIIYTKKILWLGCAFCIGLLFLISQKKPFQHNENINIQMIAAMRSIGLGLIILAGGCLVSYFLGQSERIFQDKVFIKKGQPQILLRNYDQYSLWYIPDTAKSTYARIKNTMILIQYSPNEIDTIVRVKLQDHIQHLDQIK